MCEVNQALEAQLLALGLNLIGQVMEASLRENKPIQSTDVLSVATTAYQQGKITKNQYFGVINALDEVQTVQTTATTQPSSEYIQANKFLNRR